MNIKDDKEKFSIEYFDTDLAGQRIHVNDIIAYGHALGRCAGLQIAKILSIYRVPVVKTSYRTDFTTNTRIQEEASVYETSFLIWAVSTGWRGDLILNSKKSTLQFNNRIVVLDRTKVRKDMVRLLDITSKDVKYSQIEKTVETILKQEEDRKNLREILQPMIEAAEASETTNKEVI